jgi:hypothetical protein
VINGIPNKLHELYSMWKEMRTRCSNPKRRDFKYYGGRGIKICERWNNFELFVLDMGPRPTKEHEIDRINGDGNYEPGNCKWATHFEQLQHTSQNTFLTINGITKTISEWGRCSSSRGRIRDRIERGWNVEDAILRPKQHNGNGKLAWETRRKHIAMQ